MKTIPFDIEKAKAGAKVVTRGKLPARIVCYDVCGTQPIVALVKEAMRECLQFHNSDGSYSLNNLESSYDLLLVEPTSVPWTDISEVPLNDWFRNKSESRCFRFTLIDPLDFSVYSDCTSWQTMQELFDNYEHSSDLKTWHPCGKEEV